MRAFLIAVLVCVVVAAVSTVVARCEPYPAYVYEGIVQSCLPATSADVKEESKWIDAKASQASIERQPVSIVTVRVSRLIQVARCGWERGCKPAVTPWDDVTPTEFRLQVDGECPASFLDSTGLRRFYAVRPCCDVIPARSGRCGLGLPVILDPPEWAVAIVDGK